MADNSIKLIPIRDLSGLKFLIPRYQRGYRWTEVQITDLLEDVNDFMKKKGEQSSDFYCLQPLVVKGTLEKADCIFQPLLEKGAEMALSDVLMQLREKTKWEVIDGQQRLTTIFIILSYLFREPMDLGGFELYELEYETREGSKEFLSNLGTKTTQEVDSQVDYMFMKEAYESVERWFYPGDKDKSKFATTLLDHVQFIWYETTERPTAVFKRLNLGKIGLTNAELIKALLLNKSHFGEYDKNQFIVASQWNDFENALQNDEFWLFIHDTEYGKPTRMDFIFDTICEMGCLDDLIEWKKEKKRVIGTDKYKTFRYFNAFFGSTIAAEKAKKEEGLTIIDLCWMEVKRIFRVFEEWYNDLELYHYVGYLINEGKSVQELLKLWSSHYGEKRTDTKDAFLSDLKDEIRKAIKDCKDLDKQYEIEKDGTKTAKTACTPLLLLHNIQTVIDQNKGFQKREDYKLGVFYKFPFHLYKKESWNVEHVDSNSTNELDDFTEKKKWLMASWFFVSDPTVQSEILEFIEKKVEGLDFEKLRTKVMSGFVKGKVLTQEEKNKVWNFVLLDEHTNKSYGNSIFPMKRMVISGKDRGIEYEIVEKVENRKLVGFELKERKEDAEYKTAFVPPVTKSVFMKEYNPLSANPYSWDSDDAKKYGDRIRETLKEFLIN